MSAVKRKPRTPEQAGFAAMRLPARTRKSFPEGPNPGRTAARGGFERRTRPRAPGRSIREPCATGCASDLSPRLTETGRSIRDGARLTPSRPPAGVTDHSAVLAGIQTRMVEGPLFAQS
ncbi:hypothetical protein GCM10023194_32630 [Planotetraspora phitsanulokensis]|uniref:Uncharacterized protein n=1 Tax=Planotetraspora phitsanulokensis TaxID=575192 RepID=A0A8J3XGI9_9ACTN|nr:hypothetical protein Pph01_06010 [Planotetraspora phitsanulokensis]